MLQAAMRTALLRASESRSLRKQVEGRALTRTIADRFVAGDDLADGLATARQLARTGRESTLDYLGESVTDVGEVRAAAEVYMAALDGIAAEGLPCGVSIKPTQMGLHLDPALCGELLGRIVAFADEIGAHVTLDMEGSDVTESTVALVEDLRGSGYRNVGCAVQAYLHRTEDDCRRLSAAGASLRLCKGAYAEAADVAYQGREEVRASYARCAELLLDEGAYPRFATHDDVLVDRIRNWCARHRIPAHRYEFQMLHGIREPLQRALVRDGYRVRVYVPFGAQWYPYFMRRLAERPANVAFFLRALLG